MKQGRVSRRTMYWAAAFALLNVLMYLTLQKFWIGGSSFLPLVGVLGEGDKFLFALVVNIGVIVGALISAAINGEFVVRMPGRGNSVRALIGGLLMGVGVSLAPGTCTTAFVTGMPMLSVASFMSAIGIFFGAYLAFRSTWRG